MQEFKDSRLKFVEMPKVFYHMASEINLTCKQHQRVCEQLAVRLSKEKPKTPQEFEKNEYLKDFVIKSSEMNERILNLINYTHELLTSIANDQVCVNNALVSDTLRMQSESVQLITQQREQLVKELYELRKDQIRSNSLNA